MTEKQQFLFSDIAKVTPDDVGEDASSPLSSKLDDIAKGGGNEGIHSIKLIDDYMKSK